MELTREQIDTIRDNIKRESLITKALLSEGVVNAKIIAAGKK